MNGTGLNRVQRNAARFLVIGAGCGVAGVGILLALRKRARQAALPARVQRDSGVGGLRVSEAPGYLDEDAMISPEYKTWNQGSR